MNLPGKTISTTTLKRLLPRRADIEQMCFFALNFFDAVRINSIRQEILWGEIGVLFEFIQDIDQDFQKASGHGFKFFAKPASDIVNDALDPCVCQPLS